MQSFLLRKKIEIGIKNFLIGIFRLEIKKTIVTFEISTFEFPKMQSSMLNERN